MLPKDLAAKLVSFKVKLFQVSRRILRMNKRLYDKLEEHVAEQRGWHWAMTSFAVDAWGKTQKDLDEELPFVDRLMNKKKGEYLARAKFLSPAPEKERSERF